MNSQVVKISIAAVASLVALVLIARTLTGGERSRLASAADEIQIVCSETGETWTMERGRLTDALLLRPLPIDPEVGLPSGPAGGRPVAFPADERLWARLVDQANAEAAAISGSADDE